LGRKTLLSKIYILISSLQRRIFARLLWRLVTKLNTSLPDGELLLCINHFGDPLRWRRLRSIHAFLVYVRPRMISLHGVSNVLVSGTIILERILVKVVVLRVKVGHYHPIGRGLPHIVGVSLRHIQLLSFFKFPLRLIAGFAFKVIFMFILVRFNCRTLFGNLALVASLQVSKVINIILVLLLQRRAIFIEKKVFLIVLHLHRVIFQRRLLWGGCHLLLLFTLLWRLLHQLPIAHHHHIVFIWTHVRDIIDWLLVLKLPITTTFLEGLFLITIFLLHSTLVEGVLVHWILVHGAVEWRDRLRLNWHFVRLDLRQLHSILQSHHLSVLETPLKLWKVYWFSFLLSFLYARTTDSHYS